MPELTRINDPTGTTRHVVTDDERRGLDLWRWWRIEPRGRGEGEQRTASHGDANPVQSTPETEKMVTTRSAEDWATAQHNVVDPVHRRRDLQRRGGTGEAGGLRRGGGGMKARKRGGEGEG